MKCSNTTINNDKINEMKGLCEVKENESARQPDLSAYPSYPEYYQTRLVEMLFIELVPFVFIPFASLIGLFLNWKIVQTIHLNKKKLLKEDFYKYMSANAKFNCLNCLIFAFYPMTSCNWRLSTYFCSAIFTTQFVQYFKIVMIAYFGEVFKMCANVTYLMMTLNRYLLVGKDHPPWLVSIAKVEFKWVIRCSLCVSALINIGHGWQFLAETHTALTANWYDNYVEANGNSYSDYPQANQSGAFFYYSVVYFMINFGMFFILNTVIETKLVWRMHKELAEKRERLATMNYKSSLQVLTTTCSEASTHQEGEDRKRREDEDEKKEIKVIKMVVFNGFFNFVLRAPDILFWMENASIFTKVFPEQKYTYWVKGTSLAYYVPGLLTLIADIGYLSFILTFTTNFIIFYKFNKNFKEAVVFFKSSAIKK
jgi:hypothetical protein